MCGKVNEGDEEVDFGKRRCNLKVFVNDLPPARPCVQGLNVTR